MLPFVGNRDARGDGAMIDWYSFFTTRTEYIVLRVGPDTYCVIDFIILIRIRSWLAGQERSEWSEAKIRKIRRSNSLFDFRGYFHLRTFFFFDNYVINSLTIVYLLQDWSFNIHILATEHSHSYIWSYTWVEEETSDDQIWDTKSNSSRLVYEVLVAKYCQGSSLVRCNRGAGHPQGPVAGLGLSLIYHLIWDYT